jgi:hypothetical protein
MVAVCKISPNNSRIAPMNPPALRATTSNENMVLLIINDLRSCFRGNRQVPILSIRWNNFSLSRGERAGVRAGFFSHHHLRVHAEDRDANTGAGQDLTGLAAAVQLRLRVATFFAGLKDEKRRVNDRLCAAPGRMVHPSSINFAVRPQTLI